MPENGLTIIDEVRLSSDVQYSYEYESVGMDWKLNIGVDLSLEGYKNKRRMVKMIIISELIGYKVEMKYKYKYQRSDRRFYSLSGISENLIQL